MSHLTLQTKFFVIITVVALNIPKTVNADNDYISAINAQYIKIKGIYMHASYFYAIKTNNPTHNLRFL